MPLPELRPQSEIDDRPLRSFAKVREAEQPLPVAAALMGLAVLILFHLVA